LRFCPETCDGSNLRRLRLGLRGTASTNPSEANPSCAISFAFEVCPVAASFGLRLRILGAKYGSVSFAIKVPIQILGTQIDLGSVRRHIEFGRPQDSIDDEPTEVLVSPVLVEVRPSEPKRAPTVGSIESPGKDLFAAFVFLRRLGAKNRIGGHCFEDRR